MDRYNDALADFNRAIELDPSDEDYVAKRAPTYRPIGNGEDAWPEPSGSEPPSAKLTRRMSDTVAGGLSDRSLQRCDQFG
jgi:hypothetical protein